MLATSFSEIEFTNVRGNTRLTTNQCVNPLKVINPDSHTRTCHCFITNYGAGFVQGDSLALRVVAYGDTYSVISTQGNTRVYKSREKQCNQYIEGVLKENAFHVYLNDPIVMHRDSWFVQKNNWDLENGAVLLLVDWFSAGRVQNKEVFDFFCYESETKVTFNTQPVIWDRIRIDPAAEDPTSAGAFGKNTTYLNIFLAGRHDDKRVMLIEKGLHELNARCATHGTLKTGDDAPVVSTLVRHSAQACSMRVVALDVFHIHRFVSGLSLVLQHPVLLGFSPLGSRYASQG